MKLTALTLATAIAATGASADIRYDCYVTPDRLQISTTIVHVADSNRFYELTISGDYILLDAAIGQGVLSVSTKRGSTPTRTQFTDDDFFTVITINLDGKYTHLTHFLDNSIDIDPWTAFGSCIGNIQDSIDINDRFWQDKPDN